MPVITVKIGKGQTNIEQKKQLIEGLTINAAEITQLPKHAFTIFIDESDTDSIGVGGTPLKEFLREQKA